MDAHNLLVFQQHKAYMELEVTAGIVSNEAKDSFLACIREEVEANDGEANRIRKEDEEYAILQANANAKKDAIHEQSLRGVCFPGGKGDDKGPKLFQPRFSGIQKNPKEPYSVARIVATVTNAEQAITEENTTA